MTLDELFEQLKGLKRPSNVLGHTEFFSVIDIKHFSDVEMLIRQYALDNHDSELGVLKAKVYAYEKIIANSNFAPMVIDNHIIKDVPLVTPLMEVLEDIKAEIDTYLQAENFGSEYINDVAQIIDKHISAGSEG